MSFILCKYTKELHFVQSNYSQVILNHMDSIILRLKQDGVQIKLRIGQSLYILRRSISFWWRSHSPVQASGQSGKEQLSYLQQNEVGGLSAKESPKGRRKTEQWSNSTFYGKVAVAALVGLSRKKSG